MTLRALFVLLVVLNLGVGLWWWLHDAAPAQAPADAPTGLARLQLVRERADVHAPAPADNDPIDDRAANVVTPAAAAPPVAAPTLAPPASAAVAAPPATPGAVQEVCFSFGPFADAQAAAVADGALHTGVLRRHPRQVQEGGGHGWRVFLPAQTDRAAADAVAQKLKGAGFSDLMVVANGAEANSIALGRFSSEDRAKKHVADLQAAGFAAQAQALGETKTRVWIDVAAVAGFDAAGARRASGAAQARALDCAGVR